jgi:hypothetical protein
MLVLKSTRDQMVAEAKANGAAALREMVGELTDGLKVLGLHPEPRHDETTAEMVLRYLRAALSDANASAIERITAQDERDGYREDALKYRRNVANLIPGGKPRKPAPAASVGAPTH